MNNISTGQNRKEDNKTSTDGKSEKGSFDFILERFIFFEKQVSLIEEKLKNLKKEIGEFKTFIYIIVGSMAIVFAFTSILIGLDYFKYNEERYEKFIDKTQEIQQSFYTKTQTESLIKEFKDCIWSNGLSYCLK